METLTFVSIIWGLVRRSLLDCLRLLAEIVHARIFRRIRIAAGDESKVMSVVFHVESVGKDTVLTDPVRVVVAPEDVHVVRSRVVGMRVDVVFGRGMLVAEEFDWHPGDRILCCGDTVAFGGLLGEKPNGLGVANPGRTVAVNFDVLEPPRTFIPQVSRSKDGFRSSEGMTDDYDTVVRVFVMESREEFRNRFADASPRFPEAVMDVAAFAEFGDMHFVHLEIFGPVLSGLGAAEGKDNELVSVRSGDETWCNCQNWVSFLGRRILTIIIETLDIFPLGYRHVVCLFHIWAIA